MAFMYDDNGVRIGSKLRQAGKGLIKPDGSYGDSVSMKFEPQKNPIISSLASSGPQVNSLQNNYPNGIKPPQVQLKTGEENTNKIGNFLQYSVAKRNAAMANKYDALNMKNNQFLSNLANSKYQSQQNRLEKSALQNQRLSQQQSQFNKTFDFNSQKYERDHDFEMQKYLHPISKTNNQEKYTIDRTKIFTKDPAAIVPEWDYLKDADKKIVMDSYIKTGSIPKIEKYNGDSWFGSDYRIASNDKKTNSENIDNNAVNDEEKQFYEWKKAHGYN